MLTHPTSRIVCIDPCGGLTWHHQDPGDYLGRFRANMAPYGDRVTWIRGASQSVLRYSPAVASAPFDLVYIDGDHSAPAVLEDAVLVWPYVKHGGLIVFDDYGWHVPHDPLLEPAMAIDAFCRIYAKGLVEELRDGWQVIVRRL